MGPGLFGTDPRAAKSAKDACKAITTLIGIPDTLKPEKLKSELLTASKQYWADKDYDAQRTIGDVKKEINEFMSRLMKFESRLDQLSTAARFVLNASFAQEFEGSIVSSTEQVLHSLNEVCLRIVREVYKGGAEVAVKSCCVRLWRLRETITGKDFVGTVSPVKREKWAAGSAPLREFDAPDAHFVYVVMKAIDPLVEIATVHTKLSELSGARSASKGDEGLASED